MNSEFQGEEHHPEKLDADAVCIQCGTVNSEGTLLCKICGNNLRDQRLQRMNADQALDTDNAGGKQRVWASPLLFVLAVGIIIYTVYNQDAIVESIMGSQIAPQATAEDLWQGATGRTIDTLLSDLDAQLPTEEIAIDAYTNRADGESLSGIYVLFADNIFIGSANVLVEDDTLYFGARLESGEEIRGQAESKGDFYLMKHESGGMEIRNRLYTVQGVASPQGNGAIECVGDDGREHFTCMAYRLAS